MKLNGFFLEEFRPEVFHRTLMNSITIKTRRIADFHNYTNIIKNNKYI